jgi:hypothetical protein
VRYSIPLDAVWHRLAVDLSRRQVLFIDGLRLSAQMAAGSLQLLEDLLNDADADGDSAKTVPVRALIHAYGVVDAIYRFRELTRNMPGLKKDAGYTLLLQRTEYAEDVRHHLQHLNQELGSVEEQRAPALGVVTWMRGSSNSGVLIRTFAAVPGTFYPEAAFSSGVIDRERLPVSDAVTNIRLVAGRHDVDLDKLVGAAFAFMAGIARSLEEVAAAKERLGCDMVVSATLMIARGGQADTTVQGITERGDEPPSPDAG